MKIENRFQGYIRFILLVFSIHSTQSQNNFQDSFNVTSSPSKENIRIAFSDDLGNSGHLPISIIKGAIDGPVFTIVAGVHGFEYPPIVATQELLKEIQADELAGTIVIIPVSIVFLDIHGGDASEDLIPFVCYYDNKNKSDQTEVAKILSESSGFEVSFMKKMKPYTTVISSGDNESYAHPKADAIGCTGRYTRGSRPKVFSTELLAHKIVKMKFYMA